MAAFETNTKMLSPIEQQDERKWTLISTAYQFREDIEPLWGEDTAASSGLVDNDDVQPSPPSKGQCVPTHIVLLRKLRRDFPAERFSFVIGDVIFRYQKIIPPSQPIAHSHVNTFTIRSERVINWSNTLRHHSWLTWHPEPGRKPMVIDVTSDQIHPSLSVVATKSPHLDYNLDYHPFEMHETPPNNVAPTTGGISNTDRVALLEYRYLTLRRS